MVRYMLWFCAALVGGCEDTPLPCDNDDTADAISVLETCRDADPCTIESVSSGGNCLHKRQPDLTPCFGFGDTSGTIGQCVNGLCIVMKNDFADTMCVDASTECVGDTPYIVNRLEGSCLVEWCNYNGHGRTLQTKAAGSPCVHPIKEGTPEFVVGQCSSCGNCF